VTSPNGRMLEQLRACFAEEYRFFRVTKASIYSVRAAMKSGNLAANAI
jgi:hypothetical protein